METDMPQCLTLGEFYKTLCRTAQKKCDPGSQLREAIVSLLDTPLLKVAKEDCFHLVTLQSVTGVPFVIKQKCSKKRYKLLYDGSHMRRLPKNTECPKKFGKWYILFGLDETVEKMSKMLSSCPKSHYLPKGTDTSVRLANLVDMDDDISLDPTNYDDTVAWLQERNLLDCVRINFCVRTLPFPMPCYWISPAKCARVEKFYHLEAYTGHNHTLAFRHMTVAKKRGRKVVENQSGSSTSATVETLDPVQQELHALHKNNRSCGTAVELFGLTKAFKLGMLSGGRDVLLAANEELSKTTATLWFHYDAKSQVRHVAYRDGLGHFQTWEIYPNALVENGEEEAPCATKKDSDTLGKCWAAWKNVFDVVWERRSVILAHKEKVLGSILSKWNLNAQGLGIKVQKGGTYYRCLASLKYCLNKMKIVCYCESDLFMHRIRLPLAHYLFKVKNNKRGLTMKTVTSTKVVSLISREIEIINIANCLGIKGGDENNFLKDEADDFLKVTKEWVPHLFDSSLEMLPPKPLIDDAIRSLHNQGKVYAPARISGYEKGYETCLKNRAEILTAACIALNNAFSTWICREFSLDLFTCNYMSLSSIAFKCVWLDLAEKGGPLFQSLEKTKPYYGAVLRKLCRGGFAYSCQSAISSGEPIGILGTQYPCGEPAVSVKEFDLNSAYGYSACNMSVPGGFCMGYTNTLPAENIARGQMRLCKTDKVLRAKSFEYTATMGYILQVQRARQNIVSVWSNYSALGLCYIGKYPVDLAIVLESEEVYFVNFDGQFAHGCSTCPPLKRYVGDKSLQQLLAEAQERDGYIQRWVEEKNNSGRLRCTYNVYSSCHDKIVQKEHLFNKEAFPELALLREPYQSLPIGPIESTDIFYHTPPGLTYLLVGKGTIDPADRNPAKGPPLLVWKRDLGVDKFFQDFGWETTEDTLFTRDTLHQLTAAFNFHLTEVKHCYFYRKCDVLPKVFERLTSQRQTFAEEGCKAKAKFVKSIVNYSTGMFGYNAEKRMATGYNNTRLVASITRKTLDIFKRKYTYAGSFGEKSYCIIQSNWSKESSMLPSRSASTLPIYASIVEYGKARLLDCHSLLRWGARPGAFRCLYSNTDNLVCVLASPTLEGSIKESRKRKFQVLAPEYFGSEPGQLSEKWTLESPPHWKFVSPYVCNYAIVQGEGSSVTGECKMSSFKNVEPEIAYHSNMRLLEGKDEDTFHLQERRVNRLLNTNVHQVEIRAAKFRKLH